MKILQINTVCGIGSTGRIATEINKLLIEKGHESYIAFGRGYPKNCDNTIKIGSPMDNYMHVAKTRIFDQHGFGSKKATLELVDTIKILNPDIIHLHNIHGYYLNIEILFGYLKESNKPVVWTLHDCWPFTGHCTHFDSIGCNKWITGCSNCPQKNNYPQSLIFDNSRSNYYVKKNLFTDINNLNLVPVSNWLEKITLSSFLKKKNIIRISNGIDITLFRPVESKIKELFGIKNNKIILSVASQWTEKKGLNDAINLAGKIDRRYKIILVGLTKKQLRNLPENIIGIENTEDINVLVELYSSADVYVNFSVEETFSLVTVEAMACGTPVIVYDATAIPELVGDYCGHIVRKNDIDEVLKAVKLIEFNGKDYYSQNCVDRVQELYNKDETYDKYMELYENIYSR